MCGISGIVGVDEEITAKSYVVKSLSQIKHRGQNYYEMGMVGSHACIGTNRLAIVDREGAKQPIYNKSRKVAVCFNGEIYNYKQIRKKILKRCPSYEFKTDSDTETLLAAYEVLGPEQMMKELNGMYGFVIVDDQRKMVFAARDHVGIKPLYWAVDKRGRMHFASEMKQLVQFDEIRYIHQLEPGHYIYQRYGERVDAKDVVPKKYFKLVRKRIYSDEAYVVRKLKRLISEAVRIRVDTDLPIAVQVSGGVDSTGILELVLKYRDKKDVTAVIVGAADSEDVNFAVKYCKLRGIKYISKILPNKEAWKQEWNSYIEESIYLTESFELNPVRNTPLNLIAAQVARDHGFRIMLLGEGADELFAGYPEFKEDSDPEVIGKKVDRFVKDLYKTQLLRADRGGMGRTIELRVPYLDRHLVEFAMAIDPRLLVRSRERCIIDAIGDVDVEFLKKLGRFSPETVVALASAKRSDVEQLINSDQGTEVFLSCGLKQRGHSALKLRC